jgi:hypothetical protein
VIDIIPGRGGMFSLDNGRDKRFLVRSEMCEIPGRKSLEPLHINGIVIARSAATRRSRGRKPLYVPWIALLRSQ